MSKLYTIKIIQLAHPNSFGMKFFLSNMKQFVEYVILGTIHLLQVGINWKIGYHIGLLNLLLADLCVDDYFKLEKGKTFVDSNLPRILKL